MNYQYSNEIPLKVDECLDDAIAQEFACAVIEIDTLYRQVYYYPFPSFLAATRYVTNNVDKLSYQRVVILSDPDVYRCTKSWAIDITLNSLV